MFSFIKGKLESIESEKIVIETSGVGFEINFPNSNVQNLPQIGDEIKVETYMNVREDEISLYGFLTKEDKEMFLLLLTVSGVGPKVAMHIISSLGFSTLMNAIASEDAKRIAEVKGLGQKTASKICLELGDKVRKLKFNNKVDIIKRNNDQNKVYDNIKEEVVEALKKLGYKENKARELLSKLDMAEITDNYKKTITSGELLKLALK